MRDLFGAVLLDAAVDVTQSGSGQHVGRLLVDQSVKVSLDLKNAGERAAKNRVVRPSIVKRWYLWLMENQCAIDNETSTGALVVLNYKRRAKNRGIDGAFERGQQCMTHAPFM